jgi:hypothetical protein
MSDPLAACKAALAALSGHYTLAEWAKQMELIRANLPALIEEVETTRKSRPKSNEKTSG